MILIRTLSITDDRKNISVDISTNEGNVFSTMELWTKDGYGDESKIIDLSSLLTGTGIREVLFIRFNLVGIDEFNSMYFLRFGTEGTGDDSECGDCNNITLTQAVWNLYVHEVCLHDTIVKLDLSSKKNMSTKNTRALNMGLIMDGLKLALENKWYDQAIKFEAMLTEYCGIDCTDCLELNSYNAGSGLDNGTLNNTLIMK